MSKVIDAGDIFRALADAGPGDEVVWKGVWDPSEDKIEDVAGTAEAPITLRGESQETAIISGKPGGYFAVRIENCPWFRLGNCTVEDFDDDQQRGIQIFTSDNIQVFDVKTQNGAADHIHFVGCNAWRVDRCEFWGKGGQSLGGGKGPHAIYATTLNGGPPCVGGIAADCYAHDIYGAAYQANGDTSWLSGIQFTRCWADNYGEMGGSCFNLAKCRPVKAGQPSVYLEDVRGRKHPQNGNPAVNAYDGTTGVVVVRYDFDARPVFAGSSIQDTPGTPNAPNLAVKSAPVSQPEQPNPAAELRTALARAEGAEEEAKRLLGIINTAKADLNQA